MNFLLYACCGHLCNSVHRQNCTKQEQLCTIMKERIPFHECIIFGHML